MMKPGLFSIEIIGKKKHINEIQEWSKKDSRYHIAISYPKFEYWLLLHFEKPTKILNSNECTTQLRKHIKNYEKEVSEKTIKYESIKDACTSAHEKSLNMNHFKVNGSEVFLLIQNTMSHLGLKFDSN